MVSEAPVLPRGLIFLASLWLVGAWMVSIGASPPMQPSSASYTPGVRQLVSCLAIGVIVAWPLLRLSQGRCTWSVRRALLDLAVVAALVQVVIWPMRLVTPWGVARTAAIDFTLTGWAGITAAILAVAGAGGALARTSAMAALLGLALAPAAAALAAWRWGATDALAEAILGISPFVALRSMTGAGGSRLSPEELRGAALAVGAAVAAWTSVAIVAPRRRSRPADRASAGRTGPEPVGDGGGGGGGGGPG